MNPLRAVAACFVERGELIGSNVTLAKENGRLAAENAAMKAALRRAVCERDEALGIVCDLRADLSASQRQCDLLMQMCPADLRALGETGPFDQEAGSG